MTISFVGANQAAGTTVAIPAHQAGDLIVVFAFKDGINFIDTMASPWNIAGQNGVSTTAATSNVHWQIAVNGSTVDPSIADATEMIVLVYRGVLQADPIGHILGDSVVGGEVSFPALTLEVGDGSSWGIAFAGHRFSDPDMLDLGGAITSNRATVGDAVVAKDSNGGVSAIGAWTTSGVTAGLRWCSWQIEIKAEPPVIPEVTDVQPRQFSNDDLVEITGSNFGASQGNGKVELGDNHQHNLANKVQQNIDHWEDLAIRFIANKGSLPNGQVFVFVTNDDGETNDPPPPGDPGDLDTELIASAAVGGNNQSLEVRLERIYAAIAGHSTPRVGRDTHFLMSRIGQTRGINITSGMRSFESNLAILYRDITGSSWTGPKSTELILRAIEAEL